ncbi:hypothetical protein BLNAU_10205 [Blattamonas nauphoetae]|uniref:U-box domain-containing protein n=1 Tax=Blattamonas nauphoetae TaxID=2049346 RepID=A0ABQ9XTR6_9EUKA|nr:hypothetical protein BLNAU_10205 [Blattamonas nauphoetae]
MSESTQIMSLTGTILCLSTDLAWNKPFPTFKTIEEFFVRYGRLESLNVTVEDSYQPQIDFSVSLETAVQFEALNGFFLRRFNGMNFAVLSISKETGTPFEIFGIPGTVPDEGNDRVFSLNLVIQQSDGVNTFMLQRRLQYFGDIVTFCASIDSKHLDCTQLSIQMITKSSLEDIRRTFESSNQNRQLTTLELSKFQPISTILHLMSIPSSHSYQRLSPPLSDITAAISAFRDRNKWLIDGSRNLNSQSSSTRTVVLKNLPFNVSVNQSQQLHLVKMKSLIINNENITDSTATALMEVENDRSLAYMLNRGRNLTLGGRKITVTSSTSSDFILGQENELGQDHSDAQVYTYLPRTLDPPWHTSPTGGPRWNTPPMQLQINPNPAGKEMKPTRPLNEPSQEENTDVAPTDGLSKLEQQTKPEQTQFTPPTGMGILESLNVTVEDSYQPQIDFSVSLETAVQFEALNGFFLRRFEREEFAVLSFSKEAGTPFEIYGIPDTVPGEGSDRILSLDLQVQRSDEIKSDAIRTRIQEFGDTVSVFTTISSENREYAQLSIQMITQLSFEDIRRTIESSNQTRLFSTINLSKYQPPLHCEVCVQTDSDHIFALHSSEISPETVSGLCLAAAYYLPNRENRWTEGPDCDRTIELLSRQIKEIGHLQKPSLLDTLARQEMPTPVFEHVLELLNSKNDALLATTIMFLTTVVHSFKDKSLFQRLVRLGLFNRLPLAAMLHPIHLRTPTFIVDARTPFRRLLGTVEFQPSETERQQPHTDINFDDLQQYVLAPLEPFLHHVFKCRFQLLDAQRTTHVRVFLQEMIPDLPLDQFRTSWIVPVCILCTSLISFIDNDDLVRRYSTLVPVSERLKCLEEEGWVDEMEHRCHPTSQKALYDTSFNFFKDVMDEVGANLEAQQVSTETERRPPQYTPSAGMVKFDSKPEQTSFTPYTGMGKFESKPEQPQFTPPPRMGMFEAEQALQPVYHIPEMVPINSKPEQPQSARYPGMGKIESRQPQPKPDMPRLVCPLTGKPIVHRAHLVNIPDTFYEKKALQTFIIENGMSPETFETIEVDAIVDDDGYELDEELDRVAMCLLSQTMGPD